MENYGGDIPLFADKLLFAEDLVNYTMNNLFGIPYLANNAGRYRAFIPNAFTDIIKQAVYRLCGQIEMTMFTFLYGPDELHSWDESTYLRMAKQMFDSCFVEGFEAKGFLTYCVDLVLLAKKFISCGLMNAPELAVYLIFLSLKEYDMSHGGWDTLNTIAADYLRTLSQCKNIPTPDSFASEISDGELQNMFSQSSSSDVDSGSVAPPNIDSDDKSSETCKDDLEMHVDTIEELPVFSDPGSVRNNPSPNFSEDEELMPGGILQLHVEDSDENSSMGDGNQPELHEDNPEGLWATKIESEFANSQLFYPSVKDKPLQSSLNFQNGLVSSEIAANVGANKTDTQDGINTSSYNEKSYLEVTVPRKGLNVQLPIITDNLKMDEIIENNYPSLTSGSSLKASTSYQSPCSSSSMSSINNGTNAPLYDSETVKNTSEPRGAKRLPNYDYNSNDMKRFKLSQTEKNTPHD